MSNVQPPVRKKPGPAKGDPRLVEAGRRGGQMVRAERGKEYFQQIGKPDREIAARR